MLKLLACASAIALVYPAAAQITTDIETGTDVAVDGVTGPVEGNLDAATEQGAEIEATVDDGMTVRTDAASDADADVMAESDAPLAGEKPDEAPMQAEAALDTEADVSAETEAATGQGGPENDPADVAAFVEHQFGTYDGDADGELNAEEFAAWLVPLQAEQGTHSEAELNLWAQGAFAQADADGSASVSVSEMTAFLAG